MDEPMVTIPLREYDRLRDEANESKYYLNQLKNIEQMLFDLQSRTFDLEEKIRIK